MKSLKTSIREKKRYLSIKGKNPKENIEKAILGYIGVLGMSKTGLNFIKKGKDSAVISVNRGALTNVRASLAVFKGNLTVEKISGTLKGLK